MYAQEKIAGENNFYIYNEKDGIFDENFYTGAIVLPSGTAVAKPMGGKIHIIHNNYASIINNLDAKIEQTELLRGAIEPRPNTMWLFLDKHILLVNNDTVSKIFTINNINNSAIWGIFILDGKAIFISEDTTNLIQLCSFNGKQVSVIKNYFFDKTQYQYGTLFQSKDSMMHFIYYSKNSTSIKLLKLDNHTFEIIDSSIIKHQQIFDFHHLKKYKSYATNTSSFYQVDNNIKTQLKAVDFPDFSIRTIMSVQDNSVLFTNNKNEYRIYQITDTNQILNARFRYPSVLANYTLDSKTQSYYLGTTNNLCRVFSYIKNYPNLFNSLHSNDITAITQDVNNDIWVGSYNAALTKLSNHKYINSTINNHRFMSSAISYKKHIFMISESMDGGGVCRFNDHQLNTFESITDSITGYYLYKSHDNKIYFGTNLNENFNKGGLWFTSLEDAVKQQKPNWKKITKEDGMLLKNILTITEDSLHRIWMAHPTKGIAYYDFKSKKCKTLLIEKNEIDFGALASITDKYGNVWFGSSQKGLVVLKHHTYNINKNSFKPMQHPLLQNNSGTSFMQLYRDWIVLGNDDKIILFNYKVWQEENKVVARYLNPMETNFTSTTGQNTCIIDKRDSSVWFSTGDMLYQWNIKDWLQLPTYKVTPTVVINGRSLKENSTITFPYNKNFLNVSIQYQSPDNMPRYISVALIADNDSILFPNPAITSNFTFSNLKSNQYKLYVQVCQQDGSVTLQKFPILMDTIFYKKVWFIFTLITIFALALFYLIYSTLQKNKQQKEMERLRMVSIRNQFSQHLLINVLNHLQSQVLEKPKAVKVIDQLGSAVNIIFNHLKTPHVLQPFYDEWKLVINTIDMFRFMRFPDLDVRLPDENDIKEIDCMIPLCILQIPVENALVHGLSKKEDKPHSLYISIDTLQDYIIVEIKDNGIGRKKAATLPKIGHNGVGIKNTLSMINILNQKNKLKISYDIIDLENDNGTIVKIKIPKHYNYE
jgi:ligand-binding sensor domain-containing protein